jgi:hypothetical protein
MCLARDMTQCKSRIDGAPTPSLMWPIASAATDGWTSAGPRPPALGRGSLYR